MRSELERELVRVKERLLRVESALELVRAEYPDRLLTQKEAAQQLGLCHETLKFWRQQGRLRFIRLGHRTIRIRQSEVKRLLE